MVCRQCNSGIHPSPCPSVPQASPVQGYPLPMWSGAEGWLQQDTVVVAIKPLQRLNLKLSAPLTQHLFSIVAFVGSFSMPWTR